MIVGVILILAGLLFNEVLLEALLLHRIGFNPEVRWLLRLVQVALVTAGVLFVVRRKRISQTYRDVAVVGFNLLVLFGALNVVAQLALVVRDDRAYSSAHHFHRPTDLFEQDRPALRKAYPNKSDDDIARLIHAPNITDHPTLEFMERPVRSRHYNVGFENMRYTGRIDDETARSALASGVWMFGGSTVFGHGVSDDETIPAQLDELDPDRSYVNFGVQGYDTSLELEKLIILLKKGYRPKRVIFLDGLNDMLACLSSNFSAAETPMLPYRAYSHHYNLGTFTRQQGMEAFARTLPLTRLLVEWRIDASPVVVSPLEEPTDLDDASEVYRTDPWLHYEKTPHAYQVEPAALPRYAEKVTTRMAQNLTVVRGLAEAFGFEVFAFLQPMGMISLDNPFLRDPEAYRSSEVYRALNALTEALKKAVASGALPMIDLTRADADCPGCYVDLGHYDPKLSRILAERILAATSGPPPG